MPKANLVLSNGTNVTIEGSTNEVAELLERFSGSREPSSSRKHKSREYSKSTQKAAAERKGRAGPVKYISELHTDGYFKTKRSLSDIQKKLEELGYIYALSSLSPTVLHLIKKTKILRRIKEGKNWVYVNK